MADTVPGPSSGPSTPAIASSGLSLKPGGLLETFLRKRLHDGAVAAGANPADVDNAITQMTSEHPLLDWFMQYGLPLLIQLLTNLIPK